MEREATKSQPDSSVQPGSKFIFEPIQFDLSSPIDVDKARRQIRFQRSLTADGRNYYDKSRKTPKRRITIQQTQVLKYQKPQEAIRRETAFFSGPEPYFSIHEPVEDSGGLDPDDQAMLDVDPQVLELLVEDQHLVQPSYHHIETVRSPNNPYSPDSEEDRYDEESDPNLL